MTLLNSTSRCPVPLLDHPGPEGSAPMYRDAATHLEDGYDIGGSGMRRAAVQLMRNAADALDDRDDQEPYPTTTMTPGEAARWLTGAVSAGNPLYAPVHRLIDGYLDQVAEHDRILATLDASTADDEPIGTRFRIDLPYDRPPKGLTANGGHGNRYGTAADTKKVRADVTRLATDAGLVPCARLEVRLIWAPGNRLRRDADNLWRMLKVCCDALAKGPRRDWVGLELVPDDTPEYMTKHAPEIRTPDATTDVGMWLEVDLIGEPGDRRQSPAPRTRRKSGAAPGPGRAARTGRVRAGATQTAPEGGCTGETVRNDLRAETGGIA